MTINRPTITVNEFILLIDPTEYLALTAPQRDLCNVILQLLVIELGKTATRNLLNAVFAAGQTRTNIANYLQRACSPAEKQWGADTVISGSDVSSAMRGMK